MADDHTMFREGLARLLDTYGGLEVVGETANGEEAVVLAQQKKPDVVIMQVQMPFEKARESLRRMRGVSPAPKVVIVTMFEDPRMMRELLKLGASAYVLKSTSSRHLIRAVRAAVFDPLAQNVVVGMPLDALAEAEEGSGDVLTARQLEVLLLAARGLSNHQIAARLHLAEGTVGRHLSDVYKKMEVGSRSEATRKALREEWITIMDVTQDGEGGEPGQTANSTS
ncbi:MAG: response regulator transcription factor [Rubrobacteraceae bacterium]|nr:response regulator transcription factor [Rubrobacteraceae bacterium]